MICLQAMVTGSSVATVSSHHAGSLASGLHAYGANVGTYTKLLVFLKSEEKAGTAVDKEMEQHCYSLRLPFGG